jgi:hypothetical protein
MDRRLRTFAATALLAGALSACSGGRSPAAAPPPAQPASTQPSPTQPSPAQPADARQALAASTAGLRAGDYSFAETLPGTTARGVVHLPSRSASMDVTGSAGSGPGGMQFRLVDADRYVKMKVDMGDAAEQLKHLAGDPAATRAAAGLRSLIELFSGKYWLHLDPAKVHNEQLQVDLDNPDLTGASDLLAGVESATRTGDRITGTLDASRARRNSTTFDVDEFDNLGDEAKSLPYSATLDAQGRLSRLVLDLPAVESSPAAKWTIDITGYGAAAPQPTPPAAEVRELTPDAYQVIND